MATSLSLPLTVPATLALLPADPLGAPPVLAGLLYFALFSTLIGFDFWYRGLAGSGIASAGQLQLLQPFLRS